MRSATVLHVVAVLGTLATVSRRAPSDLPRVPRSSLASDTLRVGDATLRRLTLPARTETTEVFAIVNGARRPIGTSVQTIVPSADGYLVALENRSPRGVSLDSVWIDRATLATRRHVEVTPGGWRRLTFADGRMTGSAKDSTGEHAVDVALARPLLDNSVLAAVASALPFSPGYTVTIPSFDISGDTRWMTLTVTGIEPLAGPTASVQAWKVDMNFSGAGREWSVARWLDRSTRRELQWTLKIGEREMIGVGK